MASLLDEARGHLGQVRGAPRNAADRLIERLADALFRSEASISRTVDWIQENRPIRCSHAGEEYPDDSDAILNLLGGVWAAPARPSQTREALVAEIGEEAAGRVLT